MSLARYQVLLADTFLPTGTEDTVPDGGYIRYCEQTPDRNALKAGGVPWAHSPQGSAHTLRLHCVARQQQLVRFSKGCSPPRRQEGEREGGVDPVLPFLSSSS